MEELQEMMKKMNSFELEVIAELRKMGFSEAELKEAIPRIQYSSVCQNQYGSNYSPKDIAEQIYLY